MSTMPIDKCTMTDYDQILIHIADYWGSDRLLNSHHPMYIHEFGDSAYVIRQDHKVIAYLFMFIAQTSPTAYVHLVGVHRDFQHQGLGSTLYHHFINYAKANGCTRLKAITSPTNLLSIGFHKKMGMRLLGEKKADGVEIVQDYSGIGRDCVVF